MKEMGLQCIINAFENAEHIFEVEKVEKVEKKDNAHRVYLILRYSDSNSRRTRSQIIFQKCEGNRGTSIIIMDPILKRHEEMYSVSLSECIIDRVSS